MDTLLLLSCVIWLGIPFQIEGKSQRQWRFGSPLQHEHQSYQNNPLPQINRFVSDQSVQQNSFRQPPHEQAGFDYRLGMRQLSK